ncbi:hypothetical protein G210_5610 [Candida maltosa Xu316]|uniref:Uncharacterized protein n=1 Tax=Candida maltosa (strain Xu316) TaxID=1245528 RepID=M3K2V7_CANMX|nr:hypothetical protein G210_5610 [Candida maltosa Xu316]
MSSTYKCERCNSINVDKLASNQSCQVCNHPFNSAIFAENGAHKFSNQVSKQHGLVQSSPPVPTMQQELTLTNFYQKKGQFILGFNNAKFIEIWEHEIVQHWFDKPAMKYCLLSNAAILYANQLNSKNTGNFSSSVESEQYYKMGHNYFSKSLHLQHELAESITKSIDPDIEQLRDLLKCCFIQFVCLMINNQSMLPLISFENEKIDIVSFMKFYRNVRQRYIPMIPNTRLPQYFMNTAPLGTFPDESCHLSDSMLQDLENFALSDDSMRAELQDVIELFRVSLVSSMKFKCPYPIFSNILHFSDKFRDYLYEQNVFSLRLLFVFSALCVLSPFPLSRLNNIYVAYMTWFKVRSFAQLGKFRFQTDEKLYFLVMNTDYTLDYDSLDTFDPISVAMSYEQ